MDIILYILELCSYFSIFSLLLQLKITTNKFLISTAFFIGTIWLFHLHSLYFPWHFYRFYGDTPYLQRKLLPKIMLPADLFSHRKYYLFFYPTIILLFHECWYHKNIYQYFWKNRLRHFFMLYIFFRFLVQKTEIVISIYH